MTTPAPPAVGSPAPTDASESAPPESRRPRTPWTLQRRLILTVVSIVSLILVLVSIVTSAVLGRVLEGNVDDRLATLGTSALSMPPGFPGANATASQILEAGRQAPGFLLALQGADGMTTGAVVDDETLGVSRLNAAQVERIMDAATGGISTVNVGGLHYAAGTVQLGRAIYLDAADIDCLEALDGRGVRIEGRAVPGESPLDVMAALKARA